MSVHQQKWSRSPSKELVAFISPKDPRSHVARIQQTPQESSGFPDSRFGHENTENIGQKSKWHTEECLRNLNSVKDKRLCSKVNIWNNRAQKVYATTPDSMTGILNRKAYKVGLHILQIWIDVQILE